MSNERHGLSSHKLYHTWSEIKRRTRYEKHKLYRWYGARGINMSNEWFDDFLSFYYWSMENGWKEGLQIDRIYNDGDYCSSNCQWVTSLVNNAIGKRRTRVTTKTGYTGICFHKAQGKYMARLNRQYLGYYFTIEEALRARTEAEIGLYGRQMTNLTTEEV